MPRKTKAQIALLLADLDAAKKDKRKAETRVEDLEKEITEINPKEGQYGEWSFSYGTQREILDQQEAKKMLTDRKLSVPTKMTKAPIVVKLVAK